MSASSIPAAPLPASIATLLNTADSAAFKPLGKNKLASEAQIDKLSQDFEGVFLSQMLEPMFKSENLQWFGGGESEDVFSSLMVQQFGTLLAKTGGVGIADKVKKELLSLQEVQQAPAMTAQTVKS